MSTWVASKFDAESDPNRPVVGTVIDIKGEKYRIMEVGWCNKSELIAEFMKGINSDTSVIMNKKGFDECLAHDHPTRPFMSWLVWVNKVEPENGSESN